MEKGKLYKSNKYLIESDLVILMTATINPNTFKTLAITDPAIRKRQYIEAIKYYLSHTNFKIVFAENSGESLIDYFKSYEDRLEFITYKSKVTYPDIGKGAKELELMSYALEHTKIITKHTGVIKITGRLLVLNIHVLANSFYREMKKNSSIFSCNIYKIGKMDARCFFFTLEYWTFLSQRGEAVNSKYPLESAMWDGMLDFVSQNGGYKQLRQPLRIKGMNAGFGSSYDHGFITSLLKKTRYLYLKPFYNWQIKKAVKLL